jgi:hypothetical protein
MSARMKVIGILLLLLPLPEAMAITYHVRLNGSDAVGNGSTTHPWRSLKHAVSQVSPGQGHVILLGQGIFVQNGAVDIPPGVGLEGAGAGQTFLKASGSFYYHPPNPGYAPEKFLIRLTGYNPENGNQALRNFSIDGDSKKLHGGIYVRYRDNVIIENVNVQNTNFNGIWLLDVRDSRVQNVYLRNCAWGSNGFCSGALNVGNLERVEISKLDIDESSGYGIKAIGPDGYNNIFGLKVYDSHISVNPVGFWNSGTAPNIAIELWQVNLENCEIYDSYVDNTISLVNANAIPSTGIQTIRVHNNILDIDTRANGNGYGIELTIHDAEVDHNFFIKGYYGIANWDNPMQNWSIHHNVFYALQGEYPGEIVRSQWGGLHNVQILNNTVEFEGNKTMNFVGLYGGTSNGLEIRNNLVINSNSSYSHYPNELIHTENGAAIDGLTILDNSTSGLAPGGLIESLLELLPLPPPDIVLNILPNPAVAKTGSRPTPYYIPSPGSSLIDRGSPSGFPFLGNSPDIGAFEFGSTPVVNSAPRITITNPVSNTSIASDTTLLITADASDKDGTVTKVEFYVDGDKIGEDSSSPFSYSMVAVSAGSCLISARAIDNSGAATTSSGVTLTIVDNLAPTTSIISPANQSEFPEGSTIVIEAVAADSDGAVAVVEFFSGDTKLGDDATSPYRLEWDPAPGVYNLHVRAVDNKGATAMSTSISVAVVKKNDPPVIVITGPGDKANFASGSTVNISAHAADPDGAIIRVEFYNGDNKLGADSVSPYTFAWSNAGAGDYVLTARATDDENMVAVSAPIAISVFDPEFALQLYPNPASDQVFGDFTSPIDQQCEMRILDIESRLIVCGTFSAHKGLNTFTVDSSAFTSGLYFVQLLFSSGERKSARLEILK